MTEPESNIQTAYSELKQAIDSYNEAHKAYREELRQRIVAGRARVVFDRVTRRYEMREKAFNREVSAAIKATGGVPPLAEEMLNHQRGNGFHAKGLAKIINDNTKTN